MPPSTRNCDAVMNDESSLARNATAAAISSGSANRPSGTCTRRRAARSGSLANSSRSSGVFTGPGHSALTLMPSRANCTPSSRLMASTPPLDAVYETCDVAAPITATNDAVLMTDPRPCRRMYGSTCLQHKYTEVRFTSWTRRQASRPVDRIESSSGGEMPALWNATSMRPCRCATDSYIRWTSSSLATSAAMNTPPASSAAALPAASSMSTATTTAPSAASRRALARPMPLPAPVMTATRSCRRCMAGSLRCSLSAGIQSVAMKTFLVSVNASGASGPSSRPRPDCLNPPNGVQYRTDECEFTDRLPLSTARATRIARPTSLVQIDPDRPYGVSLAIDTASASSSNGVTVTTGPKTSSV